MISPSAILIFALSVLLAAAAIAGYLQFGGQLAPRPAVVSVAFLVIALIAVIVAIGMMPVAAHRL